MLLAIETSCDETAVAVLDSKKFITSSWSKTSEVLLADLIRSQVKLHARYGGVVPELASREHEKVLSILVSQALDEAKISLNELSAIAVTQGPGLKGCLLVGIMFAKALAFQLKIPLIPVNHLHGHIAAAELAFGKQRIKYPALVVLVSGGHTQLVLALSEVEFRIVSRTRDDAAGEAFDKISSILDLGYPGGPAIAKAASSGDPAKYKLPIGMINEPEWFSFSGFKTAVQRTVDRVCGGGAASELNAGDLADLAASVEFGICQSILRKLEFALDSNREVLSVILAGGVAANKRLGEMTQKLAEIKDVELLIVPPRWCTDNAAMIGAAACQLVGSSGYSYDCFLEKHSSDLSLRASAMQCSALPRFPLVEGG